MEKNVARLNARKKNQDENNEVKVYIGNIAKEANLGLIHKFLDNIKMNNLKLMNGKNGNFVFASLPNQLEVDRAIKMYNNKEFMGQNIILKLVESPVKVYIGNIDSRATKIEIVKFIDEIKIISFTYINKKNKAFAFAIVPNVLEAEKALEMYHRKKFMGHSLVLRISPNDEKSEILSEMPKLEDIENDNENDSVFDSHDDSSSKSDTRQTMSVNMPQLQPNETDFCKNEKTCFEDSLNIQPDSNGLFSLCINKKDSNLRSKNAVEAIFSRYGSVSSVSFVDNVIIVKMPSKQQAINSFKDLGKDLEMSIGYDLCDTDPIKSTHNKSNVEIFIGNFPVHATKKKVFQFFEAINIISLKTYTRKNKSFAFALVPNILEAEKAIELYHRKMLMGHSLFIKLSNQTLKAAEALTKNNEESENESQLEESMYSKDKMSTNLSDMPKLEDIEDASDFDIHNDSSSKFSKSQMNFGDRSQLKESGMKKYDLCKNIKNSSNTFFKSPSNDSNLLNKASVDDHTSCSHDEYKSEDAEKSKRSSQDHATLFIGNFPIGMSYKQLLSLFHEFSPSCVNIINNDNPKRSTQALMTFHNPRDSEKAICKFDKSDYKGSTLLVTSVGFCPCFAKKNIKKENKALPQHVCQPTGSSPLDEKLETLSISSSLKHHHEHQQRRNNFEATNSSTHMIESKMSLAKNPTPNGFQDKNPHLHVEEDKRQQKFPQIDDYLKPEATKMGILVKHFDIQSCFKAPAEVFQVMITSVVNEELFWANTFSSLDLTRFLDLHNELQSAAPSLPKYTLSNKEKKCVALYQEEWYRAWVISSVEKNSVNVFFLDYGNISQIDLKDVRCSTESIWKLPPKIMAFQIDSDSKKLPPNAENQFFDIKLCKAGTSANGFISVVTLVSL